MTDSILRSSYAQSELLTIGEASRIANVSISTIRNWDESGALETRRTLGGHRRIVRSSLLKCLGIEPPAQSKERKICVYLRVSSQKQKSSGSLDRQEERMVEWAKNQSSFSLAPNQLLIIKDCASAFGARSGLQKLVDLMIRGELASVISEHQDRLSRVGSELRLLEHLAKTHDCNLIFTKQTIQDESDSAFMVRELVDFVTVICNRISSKKAAALARADVPQEVLERTKELLEEGYGLSAVVPQLRSEGFCSIINGAKAPISYHVLRKRLIEDSKLELIAGHLPNVTPVMLQKFIAERCVVGKGEKCWSDELYFAYCDWLKGQASEPLPRRAFVEQMKRIGSGRFVNYRSTKSRRRWQGLSLLTEAEESG